MINVSLSLSIYIYIQTHTSNCLVNNGQFYICIDKIDNFMNTILYIYIHAHVHTHRHENKFLLRHLKTNKLRRIKMIILVKTGVKTHKE